MCRSAPLDYPPPRATVEIAWSKKEDAAVRRDSAEDHTHSGECDGRDVVTARTEHADLFSVYSLQRADHPDTNIGSRGLLTTQ